MEPEKDKWIKDVLSSTNGIKRAEPNPFLYTKIQNRLNVTNTPIYLPSRTIWLTIGSFILLLAVNWQIIHQSTPSVIPDDTELKVVISNMKLYPTVNQPYDLWNVPNY